MVRNILSRGSKALNSEQQTILSAAFIMGGIYLLSAFLGFIRNRVLSTYFGDSNELGLYFAADDVPSLIFTLIVSGSISSAFVPVFIKYFKKSKNEAWEIASDVMNISFIGILIFTIIMFLNSEFIAREIIGNTSRLTDPEYKLLSQLMSILMLAQLGFLFSSYFTSILQSFHRFVIPALAPVFMNLGMILFVILFTGKLGIYAPAWGTVLGAFIHMAVQLPYVLSLGYKYIPRLSVKHKGVREIYKLITPRLIGQAGQRFLIPLNTNLALFISAPSNVMLTFADDLQSLPVRIFGMSIGQAALPILANTIKEDDISEFKSLLIKTIQQVVFLLAPISILFFILRVPLIRLSVGSSKYSWEATVMSAYSLGFFCISLVFQALVILLSKAFYALCDTKTPLKVGIVSVMINAFFAVFFVRYMGFGVWSLALAYAVGCIFNSVSLLYLISKKVKGIDWTNFYKSINKIILASYVMGIALYLPMKALDKFIFDTTRTLNLIMLTLTVSVMGGIAYILVSYLLKIQELEMISSVWLKVLKKGVNKTNIVIADGNPSI